MLEVTQWFSTLPLKLSAKFVKEKGILRFLLTMLRAKWDPT